MVYIHYCLNVWGQVDFFALLCSPRLHLYDNKYSKNSETLQLKTTVFYHFFLYDKASKQHLYETEIFHKYLYCHLINVMNSSGIKVLHITRLNFLKKKSCVQQTENKMCTSFRLYYIWIKFRFFLNYILDNVLSLCKLHNKAIIYLFSIIYYLRRAKGSLKNAVTL